MSIRRGDKTGRAGRSVERCMREDAHWWRCNRSIRYYGLLALAGTQLADIVTTAVGVWLVPTIVEANPVADRLFAEVGLLAGLLLAGGLTVVFAAGAAELFGIEVRRRFGLPTVALFAQLSVYLALSALFGAVAVHNGLLIADQTIHALDGVFASPSALGN